ncbi:MAG: anaerobic ribonucleoside-triphosphate reductase activating protein [Bacteroidales bacterium]|nr:anaerobic ribonucleoside-triphosphate reductase activating protein [Bacteroidales bacterium]
MPRVLDIIAGTTVDGPGLRTSIYFAGCHHRCPGCHNTQSWNFNNGTELTDNEIMKVVETNGFNVTFSGGDPMAQADSLIHLAEMIKSAGYTIWCYTGYKFEEIISDPTKFRLLELTDVLVDGKFCVELRDISLRFRGSSNQRLIDVNSSIRCGRIVLWDDGI